ncbi:N-acetylglucosaminidase [Bacillus sp. FJAT-29790]|uniref:N-acetylglucosaminidase n=1 Tax=Bacillus sp. FJAT-29790 TaxID=1895002 RepID=UPI001C22F2F8|nr:N-acetylglucosaminidase [Bacillus sp. FJAT-29790]MBU8881146.1 N-acetylglucosaminidase [Bacillus sp. FJAT-29790]
MFIVKKWIIWIAAILLFFSGIGFSPHTSLANSDESILDDSGADLVYVSSGDSEFYLQDQLNPVGKILDKSQINALEENEDFVYFQLGNEVGAILKNKNADGSLILKSTIQVEVKGKTAGIIDIPQTVPVYTEEDMIFAYLYKHPSYPYITETEEHFEILLGGVKGYILKKDVHNEDTEIGPFIKEASEGNHLPELKATEEKVNSIVNHEKATSSEPVQTVELTNKSAATEVATFTSSDKFFQVNTDQLVVYDNSSGKLVPVGILEKGQAYERISDEGNWHKIRFSSGFGFVYKPSTIPTSNKQIGNLNSTPNSNRTITGHANVPVYDNSSGTLIKFASINSGVTYPIIEQMGSWYKVNLSGRLGYVHSSAVKLNFHASDNYFKVTSDRLGVFDNSSGKLVQVAELKKNDVFKRVKDSGNWHQINLGGKPAFVLKSNTEPHIGAGIKNWNSQSSGSDYFITTTKSPIFDNTSGSLVEFAEINKNTKLHYLGKQGAWYKVELGGRYGYIHENNSKLPFKSTDRYFEVIEEQTFVYDNSQGSLRKVALLPKGQSFERIQDAGNWHRIKYGREFGYVWKEDTKPSTSAKAKNWGSAVVLDIDFIAKEDVSIFDNSNGNLVPFMTIMKNERYPIIGEMGSWWKITVGNRIGFINKGSVLVGPIYKNTNYDRSLTQVLNIQMGVKPQTDLYRNNKSFIHKDFVNLEQTGIFPTTGTVTSDSLNVREGTGTNSWIVGTLSLGQKVEILAQQGDWFEIKFGPWKNAKSEDIAKYLNPFNVKQNTPEYFQFLVLSQNAGISVNELNNRILTDKGILQGKGLAFIQASNNYNINEIYLISHAFLETGNGTSVLANGILVDSVDGKPVEPKIVYNMYGIGAVDRCPDTCGAETAYKNGWFTPEAAIIGGAEFISTRYINNPTYKQDTLYKMRWNPETPGSHQYATDIGWAFKQVTTIKKLYDLVENYTLYFDVPVYK